MEEADVDFLEDLLKKTSLPYCDFFGEDSLTHSYSDLVQMSRPVSRTESMGSPLEMFPWDGLSSLELGLSGQIPFFQDQEVLLDGQTDERQLRTRLEKNKRYQDELRLALASVDHALGINRQAMQKLSTLDRRIYAANKSSTTANKPITADLPVFHPSEEELLKRMPEACKKKYEAMEEYRRIVSKPGKWTAKEMGMLKDGVKGVNKKALLTTALAQTTGEELQARIRGIHMMSEEELLMPMEHIDWDYVSESFMHGSRTARECQIQWTTLQHPLIKHGDWEAEELAKLKGLIEKYGPKGRWSEIAAELGSNRPAHQCLTAYQRQIRSKEDFLKGKGRWTPEEDERLLALVKESSGPGGEINWARVTNKFWDRTATQCIHHYYKALDLSIRRGRWTASEDEMLRMGVELHGRDWYLVRLWVPGRTDMQCRERYINCLDPALKQEPFTTEEDRRLLQLVAEVGTGPVSWASLQAQHFPTRTDNHLRRRYHQLCRQVRKKDIQAQKRLKYTEDEGGEKPKDQKRGRKRKVVEAPPVPPRVAKRIPPDFQRRHSTRTTATSRE